MRAIELFPCAGGMAEGFRRAGITFDLAFDWNADACSSYERNLGHRPIQVDVRDLLRMLRASASLGPVDLLVADPPCTPWSRAGKRKGLADEADMLRETCSVIAELRPTAWLIGNVPGLDDSSNASALDKTVGDLARRHGYDVDFALLNASSYGVPQHRVRPFWFGRPKGSRSIRWPEPTHGDPTNLGLPGLALAPWVTCRDALQHLPVEDLGRPVRVRWKRDTDHKTATATATAPAPTATKNTHGDGALLKIGRVRNEDPTSRANAPSKTIRAKAGDQTSSVLLAHSKHPVSKGSAPAYTITTKGDDRGAQGGGVLRWPWDVPATTITSDERLPPPGHHPEEGSVLSVPNAVVLSEVARAILQGFPESWSFVGKTKASRSAQIGMAMPPPMAEAVARCIRAWFAAAASEAA